MVRLLWQTLSQFGAYINSIFGVGPFLFDVNTVNNSQCNIIIDRFVIMEDRYVQDINLFDFFFDPIDRSE